MKAVFEIEFESPELARKALQVVWQKNLNTGRAAMQCSVNKSVLRANISAKSFAFLRAICTSFLRDCRVFLDSAAVVKKFKKFGQGS